MRKAARDLDKHECKFNHWYVIPHLGGPIVTTVPENVRVNGREAATYGDEADCIGSGNSPPKDSIIGGNLAVFIRGSPAARIGEVTYGGNVEVGSPNVFHNDAPGPLSEIAANWLHQYLQQQKDIPFDYPWDGCYWRADRMREIMQKQFGVPCKKIFAHGSLKPATGPLHDPEGREGPVKWGYHVAPMVDGVDAQGRPVQWVMDPSMSKSTVLTKDEWLKVTKGSGSISRVTVQDPSAFAPSGSGYTKNKGGADDRIADYRDKVAKGTYADPAPPSAQVAPKKSLPPPVVRPPHVP